MLSLTGSLLLDPSRPRTDQVPHAAHPAPLPIAPDSQIAREGVPTDVDVAKADGMAVDHHPDEDAVAAGKKKRKQSHKSQVDPVGAASVGYAASTSAVEQPSSGAPQSSPAIDDAEARRLKHAKKEAKRLAKTAAATAGASAANVPNGAGEAEAPQRTEGDGAPDSGRKEKKRKADGVDGESKKKRKKDVAAL